MTISPGADHTDRMIVTTIAMAATVMQVLDTTIANVALPHMQGSLGATQGQIAWVLTSYIVAAAIATPLTGWFVTSLGRKNAFVVATVGFTIASIAVGLAMTLPQIVAFRVLQGVFGAPLVPIAQSILLDAYPRSEMGKAMSIFSIGVMTGPILGPIVGGWLTEDYSWRWAFYINVPIGIAVALAALAFLPDTSRVRDRKLDWLGFAFLSLAIASLQLLLDRGEQKGWWQSTEIRVEISLIVFGLYMLVSHSMTTSKPRFVDLRLFRDITFASATSIMFLIFMVYLGALVLLPQMLQTEFGYPVLTAGLAVSPRGLGMLVMMFALGRLSNRINLRATIILGMILNGASLYLMSRWSLSASMSMVVWTGVLQGLGMGALSLPISMLAFSTLPTDLRTDGAAFFNLIRNLGGAAGISIVTSRMVAVTQTTHARLAEFVTPFRHGLPQFNIGNLAGLRATNLALTQQAAMVAYVDVYFLLAVLHIAMLPLVFLLRMPDRRSSPQRLAPALD